MLFKNAELFNICDMQPAADGGAGYDLFRLPRDVREAADPGVRDVTSRYASGAEIRFVIHSGYARVTLRATAAHPEKGPLKHEQIIVYYGGMQSGGQNADLHYTDAPTTLTVAPPPAGYYPAMERIARINGFPFAPNVVRLLLPNQPLALIDIEGDIRPPEEDEVPALRGLMYGSSITHGALALSANLAYPFRIGRRLRADICNLGFAGSCHIEKSVADYIASRTDCDFFFSELGVNMLGMPIEEFESRVRYYIQTAASAHAGKYFIVTDLYYNAQVPARAEEFREVVRRVVEECDLANVHYICGLDLLTSSAGLCADLVHPHAEGMDEITRNLGDALERIMSCSQEDE